MFLYLVDWGNGFIGGYTRNLDQQFNTPKRDIFDDLKFYKVESFKIITPQKLNKLRGFCKPSSQEYFGIQEGSTHDV